MRLCRECGFPRRFSRFLEWHTDGTISSSVRPRIPLMFLEVDEWDTMYDELAITIGGPIEHIVVEAQKHIGMDLYDMVKGIYWNINAKRVPNSRYLRPEWLGRVIVWGMRNDLAGLGAGRAHLESYRAGDHLTLRFANPCLMPLIVGNSQGIYESIERMPGSKAGFKMDGDDLLVYLMHAEEKPVSEDRLYLEEAHGGPGPLSYDTCPACRVPRKMALSLEWHIDRGEISNPLSGKREDMMAVQSINAILRELELELGEEVIDIVFRAQKWYSLSRLEETGASKKQPEEFWPAYLEDMALRGLGHPVEFEPLSDEVTVKITNAYNQDLFAARVAAGLEALTGRATTVGWEKREHDDASYTIRAS